MRFKIIALSLNSQLKKFSDDIDKQEEIINQLKVSGQLSHEEGELALDIIDLVGIDRGHPNLNKKVIELVYPVLYKLRKQDVYRDAAGKSFDEIHEWFKDSDWLSDLYIDEFIRQEIEISDEKEFFFLLQQCAKKQDFPGMGKEVRVIINSYLKKCDWDKLFRELDSLKASKPDLDEQKIISYIDSYRYNYVREEADDFLYRIYRLSYDERMELLLSKDAVFFCFVTYCSKKEGFINNNKEIQTIINSYSNAHDWLEFSDSEKEELSVKKDKQKSLSLLESYMDSYWEDLINNELEISDEIEMFFFLQHCLKNKYSIETNKKIIKIISSFVENFDNYYEYKLPVTFQEYLYKLSQDILADENKKIPESFWGVLSEIQDEDLKLSIIDILYEIQMDLYLGHIDWEYSDKEYPDIDSAISLNGFTEIANLYPEKYAQKTYTLIDDINNYNDEYINSILYYSQFSIEALCYVEKLSLVYHMERGFSEDKVGNEDIKILIENVIKSGHKIDLELLNKDLFENAKYLVDDHIIEAIFNVIYENIDEVKFENLNYIFSLYQSKSRLSSNLGKKLIKKFDEASVLTEKINRFISREYQNRVFNSLLSYLVNHYEVSSFSDLKLAPLNDIDFVLSRSLMNSSQVFQCLKELGIDLKDVRQLYEKIDKGNVIIRFIQIMSEKENLKFTNGVAKYEKYLQEFVQWLITLYEQKKELAPTYLSAYIKILIEPAKDLSLTFEPEDTNLSLKEFKKFTEIARSFQTDLPYIPIRSMWLHYQKNIYGEADSSQKETLLQETISDFKWIKDPLLAFGEFSIPDYIQEKYGISAQDKLGILSRFYSFNSGKGTPREFASVLKNSSAAIKSRDDSKLPDSFFEGSYSVASSPVTERYIEEKNIEEIYNVLSTLKDIFSYMNDDTIDHVSILDAISKKDKLMVGQILLNLLYQKGDEGLKDKLDVAGDLLKNIKTLEPKQILSLAKNIKSIIKETLKGNNGVFKQFEEQLQEKLRERTLDSLAIRSQKDIEKFVGKNLGKLKKDPDKEESVLIELEEGLYDNFSSRELRNFKESSLNKKRSRIPESIKNIIDKVIDSSNPVVEEKRWMSAISGYLSNFGNPAIFNINKRNKLLLIEKSIKLRTSDLTNQVVIGAYNDALHSMSFLDTSVCIWSDRPRALAQVDPYFFEISVQENDGKYIGSSQAHLVKASYTDSSEEKYKHIALVGINFPHLTSSKYDEEDLVKKIFIYAQNLADKHSLESVVVPTNSSILSNYQPEIIERLLKKGWGEVKELKRPVILSSDYGSSISFDYQEVYVLRVPQKYKRDIEFMNQDQFKETLLQLSHVSEE